jgi:hypothetical protein
MQAAKTPSTRTSVAVSQKNSAIKFMQRSAKALADIIRAQPLVTDAQLLSLGLLPRPKPTRRRPPDSAPLVRVVSVSGRVVTIRVCDRDSSGRSKPFAAWAAQVYSSVSEQPPGDESDYRLQCITSRTGARITFSDEVPSGATVWLSARWITRRGETSVASVPISFTLQGGPVVPVSESTPQPLQRAA